MNIVILGDLFPQSCNEKYFENGQVNKLLDSELEILLKNSDYTLCNLEGAFSDDDCPIDKSGPCIKASERSAEGLKAMGIDGVSLANNHILDYGREGLMKTLDLLDRLNIHYFGAGNSCEDARKPLIVNIAGIKVGFYSCAEYEFTIADSSSGGANPFSEIFTFDDIQLLKQKCNVVVVLYHGSKEYYRYAVPYVQSRARKMIDKGADVVLCQHSHCIGCEEKWGNGHILYGQGNFLFHRGDNEYLNSGLVVNINFSDTGIKEIEYIPVIKNITGVRIANIEEKKSIMNAFNVRSSEIKSDRFVQEQYSEFANTMFDFYLDSSLGKLSVISRIFKRLKLKMIYRFIYNDYYYLQILNNLRCEAHRDLFVTGLKNKLSNQGEESKC